MPELRELLDLEAAGARPSPDAYPRTMRRARRIAIRRRIGAGAIALALFAGLAGSLWFAVRSRNETPGPTRSNTPSTPAPPASWESGPSAEDSAAALAELPVGWTRLAPPPMVRARAASVWTGSELFYWGGDTGFGGTHHGDGAMYDPVKDAWRELPPAPLSGRSSPAAVWTGSEVIVWGGYDGSGLADGAAFDPATGMWRSLPRAPIPSRVPVAVVWTGSELIVWGNMDRAAETLDGAAYDPVSNSWRAIADAPSAMNLGDAAWTGREMIVVGAQLDGNNASETDYAVGLAYDPSEDAWRVLPEHPVSPQSSSIAWLGRKLFVWDYVPRGAVYDPPRDAWRSLTPMPLDPSECYARTAVAEGVALAWYCGQGAEFFSASEAWRRMPTPPGDVYGDPVGTGPVVLFAGAAHESVANGLFAYRPRPDP